MMIHAILADDEVLARQKLRQLLRDEPEIEIVGEGASASETIDLVRATGPELLFLDIRMPGMDGFDIIGKLSVGSDSVVPRIIFTTAYDCYALRAFEIHAVDYLLKPFTSERLHSAVQRAREEIYTSKQSAGRSNGRTQNPPAYTTRIVFKSHGRILFLPVSDIRWIRAEENYARICTGAEKHLLRETMSHLEEKLDPQMFLRVHRSAIVNLQYLKEVRTEPSGEFTVVLVDGQKIAMSRSFHARISQWMARS
jgi:two-component system LytT family response regulator